MSELVKTVTDVINGIDQSKPEAEATVELLNTLEELAQTKADLYEEQIALALENAGKDPDKTLPIITIMLHEKGIRAAISDKAQIAKGVADAVKSLLGTISTEGGDWAKIADKGINIASAAINGAINTFLGKASGDVQDKGDTHIVLDAENMELLRIDYHVWQRDIKTASIKTRVEKVVAYSYTKSVVDMPKVNYTTFQEYFLKIVKEDYNIPDTDPIAAVGKCKEFFIALGGQVA